jgi:hypothetical protein
MSKDRKAEAELAEERRIETERLTAQAEYVARFVAEGIGATAILSNQERNTWLVQAEGDRPPLIISMGLVRGNLRHYRFEIPLSEMPQIWATTDGKKMAVFNHTETGPRRANGYERITFSSDGYTSSCFGPKPHLLSEEIIGARRVA